MSKKKVATKKTPAISKKKFVEVVTTPTVLTAPPPALKERTTLITTGMRSHVEGVFDTADYAALDLDMAPPKTADEMWEVWNAQLVRVHARGSLVPGAGERGIASSYLRDQVCQLARPENVWFMSNGLGLVQMSGKYPQYHLGKMESDIRKFPGMDPDAITEREWWNKLVGGGWGLGFEEVITAAVENGHRVLVTIVGINYYVVADDLARLIQRMTEDPEFDQRVRRQVRLVGQGLETAVPAPLLPCVMPFDATALVKLVPGSRTNSLRRMAFLLQSVTESSIDALGGSDPIADTEKLEAAFVDGTPLVYQSFSDQRALNRSTISDLTLTALMRDHYMPRVGPNIPRIIRMLKHDGHKVPRVRVENAVRRARDQDQPPDESTL